MLLSLIRADSGDDRSVFGDFWFTPIGSRSATGALVTAESALRHTAVMAAVRLLANTMGCLPFCLYRTKEDGGKERVTDDWRYRILARRPNRWQNAFEWRVMMQGHLELRGNAYNEMVSGGNGEVTELIPLHPDRVQVQAMDDRGNYRFVYSQRDGSQRVLAREAVFHLRGLSSDGVCGVSTIDAGREAIAVGLSSQQFAARFFQNDARPLGGWIEYPGSFKDRDAKQAFLESYQQGQGGINRGKTAVFERGMKFHEVGLNNKDSQFIETLQANVSTIAMLFGVPPHLIGDLSRSTNNNIEQHSLEFVNFTMAHRAELWEYAIESAFIRDDEDLEVEFDFANLLRGDSAARSEYYSSGITNGWLTRNEARLREGLDPLDELDEPLQPLNMAPAGTPPESGGGDGNPGQSNDEGPNAVVSALAERAVTREVVWLRKAVKDGFDAQKIAVFYEVHCAWLAQRGVPESLAKAWCLERADELSTTADIPTTLVEWARAGGAELAARCSNVKGSRNA